MTNTKKIVLAAVICGGAYVGLTHHWTLLTTKCHGAWTNAELFEVNDVAESAKKADPTSPVGVGQLTSMVDHFECSGVSHADAVKNVAKLTVSFLALRTGRP